MGCRKIKRIHGGGDDDVQSSLRELKISEVVSLLRRWGPSFYSEQKAGHCVHVCRVEQRWLKIQLPPGDIFAKPQTIPLSSGSSRPRCGPHFAARRWLAQ